MNFNWPINILKSNLINMQNLKQTILNIAKNSPKQDILLTTFVSAIFLSLFYWFPRPYYFVWSDNEPEILGNALHILEWGAVNHVYHPGIITANLVALLIKIGQLFSLQLDESILLIRLTFVCIVLFCSYCACNIFSSFGYFEHEDDNFIITITGG